MGFCEKQRINRDQGKDFCTVTAIMMKTPHYKTSHTKHIFLTSNVLFHACCKDKYILPTKFLKDTHYHSFISPVSSTVKIISHYIGIENHYQGPSLWVVECGWTSGASVIFPCQPHGITSITTQLCRRRKYAMATPILSVICKMWRDGGYIPCLQGRPR